MKLRAVIERAEQSFGKISEGTPVIPPLDANSIAVFTAFCGLCYLFLRARDDAHGGRQDRILGLAATLLYILLVFVRAPSLLTFYRLWAEAGTLYFSYAYVEGPLLALINPASNYFDLSINLASAAAVVLGLQWWPLVDTALGLMAALTVPFVLRGLGFHAGQRIGLLLAIATAVYCVTASETFGTVLHNKGWGAVYTFLVLASLAKRQPITPVHKLLLVILPFTGPPAAFVFFIWLGMSLALRLHAAFRPLVWAIPGLAVQIATVVLLPQQSTGFAMRPFSLEGIFYLPDIALVKVIGAIFAPSLFFRGTTPGTMELVAACLLVLGALAAMVAYLERHRDGGQEFALLLPLQLFHFFATALLALGGAAALMEGGNGIRYYFPAVAMFAASIALFLGKDATTLRRAALLKSAFSAGCLYVVAVNYGYNSMLRGPLFTPDQVDWRSQAADHMASPQNPMVIYPKGWTVQLPDCGEHYC